MSRCGADACISKCTTRFAMMPPLAIPTHATPRPRRPPDPRPCRIPPVGSGRVIEASAVSVRRAGTTHASARGEPLPDQRDSPAGVERPPDAERVWVQQVLVLRGPDSLPQSGDGRDAEGGGDKPRHDTVPGPFLGGGPQLLHHGRYDEPDPNQPEQ